MSDEMPPMSKDALDQIIEMNRQEDSGAKKSMNATEAAADRLRLVNENHALKATLKEVTKERDLAKLYLEELHIDHNHSPVCLVDDKSRCLISMLLGLGDDDVIGHGEALRAEIKKAREEYKKGDGVPFKGESNG